MRLAVASFRVTTRKENSMYIQDLDSSLTTCSVSNKLVLTLKHLVALVAAQTLREDFVQPRVALLY